jgi:hypothetical protein
MRTMTKGFLFLSILALGSGFFWWWRNSDPVPQGPIVVSEKLEPVVVENREPVLTKKQELPAEVPLPEKVLIAGVPFTVQAPFAEWSDPTFQDACEEASLVMVQAWRSGTSLTRESAKQEIWALAMFAKKEFGHSIDTSIQDTAWLLEQYYNTQAFDVRSGIEIRDIQKALAEKKLVIVPTDGRKLKNLNFTQPGPPRHMLVIVGYDTVAKEFIVNDPGTRQGEGYRYKEEVLYEAILDYPTGKHLPATSTDKVMLVVEKD